MRYKMYINNLGEQVYQDENGDEYILDELGNRRPPMLTGKIEIPNEPFRTYDSSKGHCTFCGRLDCNGSCFK